MFGWLKRKTTQTVDETVETGKVLLDVNGIKRGANGILGMLAEATKSA